MSEAILSVAGISLITPERLENLERAVIQTCHLPGDMAEVGVYRGGSAKVISASCPRKTLHLFDTFTGLPYTELASKNPTNHPLEMGRFACTLLEVMPILNGLPVIIYPGVFPQTTQALGEKTVFSFAHIDCDLYKSAVDSIDWFWPRMVSGGIMFFDDYGCDFTGVTDAVNEAFQPEQIVRQVERSNNIKIGCLVVKP